MTDLIGMVRRFSDRVKNDRDCDSIFAHLQSEVSELQIEVSQFMEGEDGVVGESVDVILCALDLIFQHSPHLTDEQILAVARRKCEKWERVYGEK